MTPAKLFERTNREFHGLTKTQRREFIALVLDEPTFTMGTQLGEILAALLDAQGKLVRHGADPEDRAIIEDKLRGKSYTAIGRARGHTAKAVEGIVRRWKERNPGKFESIQRARKAHPNLAKELGYG